MNPPLVVIAGPTASGKSALAMNIATSFKGEVIAADSRTIYKGMDIGTAKPSKQDQNQIRHHLLDIVEPGEAFTAAEFKRLANRAIQDVSRRGRLPIVVGGTGLYIDAVIFDYQFGMPANPVIRDKLNSKTIEELQKICNENNIDLPVNSRNRRHLIRAIELGGLLNQPKKLRPRTIVVGIKTDKDELRDRITKRAHVMVERGILDEATRLAKKYGWGSEAMTGNIYRILRPVIEKKESLESALEKIIISDMHLAKRQVTWLKRNPYIIWGDATQLYTAVEHFVQQNNAIESMPASP